MAPPSSYTETTLAEWMKGELRAVATFLQWTDVAEGHYTQAVNSTLRAYGVSSISSATDMRKLETLARREAWRAAVSALVAAHDFAADGGEYKLSQMQEAAKQAFLRASQDASAYDSRRSLFSSSSRVVPRW